MKVLNSSVEIRVEIAARRISSPAIQRISALCTISVHCVPEEYFWPLARKSGAWGKYPSAGESFIATLLRNKSEINTSAAAGRA
jgi:hypothetical protein